MVEYGQVSRDPPEPGIRDAGPKDAGPPGGGGKSRTRRVVIALALSAVVLVSVIVVLDKYYWNGEEPVEVTGGGHEVDLTAVWTQYRANVMHDGRAPAGTSIPSDLEANWKSTELNFEEYSASKSSPAVDTDLVFIGADTGKLHAVWRSNGTHAWDFQVRECDNGIHGSPAFDEDHVYVGAYDGWLYCLDKTTGDLLWETDMAVPVSEQYFGTPYRYSFYIGASPMLYNDVVYIGVEMSKPGGSLVGCDKDTGEAVFISKRFGSHPHSSPTVDPATGYIFIGSNDDNMYCYDTATGDEVWVYKTGGDIKSTPAVAGDVVLVTSWDYKLHAVNILTGEMVWEYGTGARIMSSPSVWLEKGLVYTGSHDYYVHCVELETGERVWRFKTDGTVLSSPTLVIDSGTLLIGSRDDHMYVLDLEDGEKKASYLFGSDITSVPVATGNAVYLFTNDGYLYELS
jgi:outer membrane protein assembly factor BamB